MLVAALLLGQIVASPLQRATLPNGARVSVEGTGSGDAVVVLAVGAGAAPDTPETHGFRHLWEHLVAKRIGPGIEAAGGRLIAETTRDATFFTILIDPDKLSVAWESVSRVAAGLPLGPGEVEREVGIIGHEYALRSEYDKASAEAWAVYGDRGLDGYGPEGTIKGADADALLRLHERSMVGSNIALAAVGDFDTGSALASARSALQGIREGEARFQPRPVAEGEGRSRTGRAAWTAAPSIEEPAGLALLGVGLVLAQDGSGGLVVMPSPTAGMVTVATASLMKPVAEADRPLVRQRARNLAARYWQRLATDQVELAKARALWGLAGRSFNPMERAAWAERLDDSLLDEAIGRWNLAIEGGSR
ncbi:MAG: insulinase family protein [Fimbriimonadaceae bacterium]|nr:insulinase family protein [Fimbriimonadaceae bacterium]QYK54874.1 MAG: insulinase family protein [Fimbriimonadaceae bacterium]